MAHVLGAWSLSSCVCLAAPPASSPALSPPAPWGRPAPSSQPSPQIQCHPQPVSLAGDARLPCCPPLPVGTWAWTWGSGVVKGYSLALPWAGRCIVYWAGDRTGTLAHPDSGSQICPRPEVAILWGIPVHVGMGWQAHGKRRLTSLHLTRAPQFHFALVYPIVLLGPLLCHCVPLGSHLD